MSLAPRVAASRADFFPTIPPNDWRKIAISDHGVRDEALFARKTGVSDAGAVLPKGGPGSSCA
jgi:hypothetical protein